MKLRWSAEARADLREIRDRIRVDDRRAALRMSQLFRERAAQLVVHPGLGRPGRLEGTRELVVHPNYILVYRIEPKAVRIVMVWHAARHWPPAEESDTV